MIREQRRNRLSYMGVIEPKQEVRSEMWTLHTKEGEDGHIRGSMQMHTHVFGMSFTTPTVRRLRDGSENSIMTVYIVDKATRQMSSMLNCDLVLINDMDPDEIPRMRLNEEMATRSGSSMYIKLGLSVLAFGTIIRDIIDYMGIGASEIMTTDMYVWVDAIWQPGIHRCTATYAVGSTVETTSTITDLIALGDGSSIACLGRLIFKIEYMDMNKRRLKVIFASMHMSFVARATRTRANLGDVDTRVQVRPHTCVQKPKS
ncbi:hypothetical protein Asppvi_003439 [Aspergillus pseudoviridinutans]|uniref:Uncharacterized protein n=1 Tax=Aspergillus pseudoviridinutans TaxID=1517512 RepID=A0A9P3ESC8_9EURO|nr:uncharacterized protein Asppvi_003439 [Aspergillus pseudoviridinutans]GIJ84592.1 hypothetical protein Asppvi_003439 [Aspergillus pseudoviridinutans]